MSEIKIIDNVLPRDLFENLHTNVFSRAIPWMMSSTTTDEHTTFSFQTSWFPNGNSNYDIPDDIVDAYKLISKQNDIKNLIRVRIGLIHRDKEKNIHPPHIDMEEDHKTALLYIDGDGETIFYEQEYLGIDSCINAIEFIKNTKMKKRLKVYPKKNRVVMFDGSIYHSSSTPIKNQIRIAINFNYKEEKKDECR